MGAGTGTIPQIWILKTSHKICFYTAKHNLNALGPIVQSLYHE
jgi:hypothetical protein